jgi:hypothetical protein
LEAKQVKCQSKSKGDLTKMAKYMKDTIDSINKEGFDSISIIGIIASASSVLLYVMDHVYDYMYTLLKTNTFHVPVDCYDMYRIICIIPIVIFVRNVVVATTNQLAKLPHNRVRRDLLKFLSTYHTPSKYQQLASKELISILNTLAILEENFALLKKIYEL